MTVRKKPLIADAIQMSSCDTCDYKREVGEYGKCEACQDSQDDYEADYDR